MARKYGKQAAKRGNIWDYSFIICGESGLGKSTILKEIAERTVGNDGYIALNIGGEDGHSSIRGGIITEDVPNYKTWWDITEDIIKNKETDYPDLKVLICDTLDEFIPMLESESVRQWNATLSPADKKATSVKSAWLGFGKGEKKAVEIGLKRIKQLEAVGVHVWYACHVKKSNVVDPVTLETYVQLTANLEKTYFEAFKTKVQLVGVCNIDRDIVEEKLGRKNIVTHKEETVKRVKGEERRINFRDPAFAIDSKSRFDNIPEAIPMDADVFIEAFNAAIKSYEDSVANNPYNKGAVLGESKKATPAPIVEEPEDEPETYEEDPEIEATEITEANADKEARIEECRNLFKAADKEVRVQVKRLLDGGKLDMEMDDEILSEIYALLTAEEDEV